MSPPKELYSCRRCPAYCCSYLRIIVTKRDLGRLAKHFKLDLDAVRRRFTKRGDEPGEIIFRHQKDEHYGSVCQFLDRETRSCTIYQARPAICRDFPGGRRCGYYDFLSFERRAQEDPDYVSTTFNR